MGNVLVVKREARRRRQIRIYIVKWATILAILLIGLLIVGKMYHAQKNETVLTEGRTMEALDDIIPGTIPSYFQFDERWRYKIYGDGTMEFNGCGPTCLSMVLCGLSGETKYDPLTVARLADDWGYYADGAGSAWSLMSEGARKLGLDAQEVAFNERNIRNELRQGKPIICVVGPGDFTTTGHYIVLCGMDDEGLVTVHDPNSQERSERTWELDQLMPQIKNLWSYQLRES